MKSTLYIFDSSRILPECFDASEFNPSLLVPRYLVHSYLYYELGASILSDWEFDTLARDLREHWESITHEHKGLIDYKALCGSTSGFYLEYPERVKGCAQWLLNQQKIQTTQTL